VKPGVEKETVSDPKHSSDEIVADIRNAIVGGTLALGSPVTEPWIAEKYGISRTLVREVIMRLISEGYLERKPYHSASVRKFSSKDVQDILEARELLEVFAAQRAVGARREQRVALQRALDEYLAAMDSGNVARSAVAHRDLHVAMVGMSGNVRLMKQEERLMVDSSLVVAVIDARRDDVEKMKSVHADLARAFLDADAELSARLVREHLYMVDQAAHEEFSHQGD